MPPRIRIGVIGWDHPEWRGVVYPRHAAAATFLTAYARRFPIVEAASGFYGMPSTATVARWAEETPEGFGIALKAPAWLLDKATPSGWPDLRRALDVLATHVAPLEERGKLLALVAQFPPGFRSPARAEDLARFVGALPGHLPWAIELRHDSWWRDRTYRLLEGAGVTLVWSALGGGFRTPPVVTSSRLYLRLFGERDLRPPFDAKRRDAGDELAEWVGRIHAAAPRVDEVDVLVSKTLEGFAPATVETLEAWLDARPAPPRLAHGQTTLPLG